MEHQSNLPADLCEQEQLHYSGAIQPFAVLLAINSEGTITHLSANAVEILETKIDLLLGKHISTVLGKAFSVNAGTKTTLEQRRILLGTKTAWNKTVDISITNVSNGHLIELQAFRKKSWFSLSNISNAATKIVDDITFNYTQDLNNLTLVLARQVRNLSGYTRAMIYKFHDDWSGEVIAEVGGDKEPNKYLGLRFPASDIPKIARDIYLKTPYRLIPDITATPVPLISLGNNFDQLDITYADSRSVSPLHLTYMKNSLPYTFRFERQFSDISV